MSQKKRYNLYLNVESTEVVQAHLEKLGMTFSGFLNKLLVEFAKEIQGQPTQLDKDLSKLTLEEFGKLMNYWVGKADSV